MAGICPACGLAYAKWRPPEARESPQPADQPLYSVPGETREASLKQRLLATLTQVPEPIDPGAFWTRVVLFALFFLWGWWFILGGVDWERIGGSFLHSVNLPFHEFGHVIFAPFGRFMMILGGSLFQILMPLIAMASFSLQMRDNFAAAIMLWWCGQNFIDVAPYIADAKHRSLPLILGMGEESHDWGNLLTMTGLVDQAQSIANLCFAMGVLIILLSYWWAVHILRRQWAMLHLQEGTPV